MRAAHLVTSRGLADLRELGAIDERDGRLHLSEGYPTWTWLSGTLMEIGIAVAARARQLKVRAPMPEGWVPPPGWAMLSSWLGRSEPGLVVFYHSAASAMAPRAMSPQDIQTFRRLIEQTRKGQTKRSRER